ncbi:MAG: AMP-dependent synthetase, partial [Ectopseudomonas oleovorans]
MSQSLQLPLERFNHWLHRQPDAIWLRQPVEGVWHDYSWRQVDDQARRLASALLALGCVPGERVALLAKNCAEWFISDLAIQLAGLVSVPLHPLQAPEQIAYVLEQAGCKVILVGKLDEPDKLATGIAAHITRIAMPYPTMPAEHQWQALLAAHESLLGAHLQRGEDLLS